MQRELGKEAGKASEANPTGKDERSRTDPNEPLAADTIISPFLHFRRFSMRLEAAIEADKPR